MSEILTNLHTIHLCIINYFRLTPISKSKRQIETKTMVKITEEEQPLEDLPVENPVYIPADPEALVYDADHYKSFLRGQLEVFLPSHEQAQDELVQILPSFLFLPQDASAEKKRIYDEVCVKKARLMRLQRERDALTDWFMTFLAQEIPGKGKFIMETILTKAACH